MAFLRFRDDSRKIELKAREMVRQQGDAMLMRGVEATLPFVNEGRPATLTILADECQYQPGLERAAFKGNVELRTDDGFELDTDTLKYWGDKERAFTRDPLRFKRGALSGTATGLEYRAGSGLLLQDSVRVRIEDAAGPPADIESQSATASREERVVTFTGAVVARQGTSELRSQSLRLDTSADMGTVERATATGDVDLVSGAGAPLPGSAAPPAGAKRLRSQRLEVVFRAKGILQEAVATRRGVAGDRARARPAGRAAARERAAAALRLRRRGAAALPPGAARDEPALGRARPLAADRRAAHARGGRLAPGRERHVRGRRSIPYRARCGTPSSRARSCSASRGARPGPATRPSTPRRARCC